MNAQNTIKVTRPNFSKMFKEYLLSCVCDYNGDVPETEAEKVKLLVDTFVSEKGYDVKHYGLRKAAENWLRGLPTTTQVEYYNNAIEEKLRQWSFIKETDTEYKAEQKVEQYWYRLGCEIAKLTLKEKGYGFRF